VPAGRLSDAQIATMSPAELIANAKDLVGGQQINNPFLRKKLGLDG
jgi:hypothetical protein